MLYQRDHLHLQRQPIVRGYCSRLHHHILLLEIHCENWANYNIMKIYNPLIQEKIMLEIIRDFCKKEIIKSTPKHFKCAFDSFRSTKTVILQCPFDLDYTEFTRVFVYFFSSGLALCFLKLFVSFSIATPLAVALFAPSPVIYPVVYPILAAVGYRLSSKVLDDLF